MGRRYTIEEMEAIAIMKEMPLGTTEAIFDRAEWKLTKDEEDRDVIQGVNIYFEGYHPVYLMMFEDGKTNYQFEHLLGQLECEGGHNLKMINETGKGKKVKLSRYEKEVDTKVTREEYNAWKSEHSGYAHQLVRKNGKLFLRRTFINNNFNLQTIQG